MNPELILGIIVKNTIAIKPKKNIIGKYYSTIPMDDQISAILKNISKKEIRTMEEVQKRTRDAVHDIFEEFMC